MGRANAVDENKPGSFSKVADGCEERGSGGEFERRGADAESSEVA